MGNCYSDVKAEAGPVGSAVGATFDSLQAANAAAALVTGSAAFSSQVSCGASLWRWFLPNGAVS